MPSVNPFGKIYPTVARNCLLMGNRGNLRKKGATDISKQWANSNWIYCVCEGDPIEVAYTKLFFLDEVTALAAVHRPCWSCKPDRYTKFKFAWLVGNPEYGFDLKTDIKLIDKIIDSERKNGLRHKATYPEEIKSLPDGVMVILEATSEEGYLLLNGFLRKWTPSGYTDTIAVDSNRVVHVLTPKSVVNAIKAGFFQAIGDSK